MTDSGNIVSIRAQALSLGLMGAGMRYVFRKDHRSLIAADAQHMW